MHLAIPRPLLRLVIAMLLVFTVAGLASTPASQASTDQAPGAAAAQTTGASDATNAVDAADVTFSAALVNVGNVSPHCAEQAFSLCLVPLEERVAAGLAALDPDVVALIEVLPPGLCDGLTPINPFNSCALEADGVPQVQRLLAHDDYEVVCGDRNAWDCLAVRASLGTITGCDGGYCGGVAASFPVPDGCDDGFETFVVDATLAGLPMTVGVGHPDSMEVDCRADSVAQLFDAFADDVRSERTGLILGDLNLDPYRERDASVELWDAATADDGPLRIRSGIAEHDPPLFTLLPLESAQLDPTGSLPATIETGDLLLARTIDHVLTTRELDGDCVTLGEAEDTERIEGPAGGLDHRAVACELRTVPQLGPPPSVDDHGPPDAATADPDAATADPVAPTSPVGASRPVTTPLPATGGGASALGPLLLTAVWWLGHRPERASGAG